jgi:hypothetical protein
MTRKATSLWPQTIDELVDETSPSPWKDSVSSQVKTREESLYHQAIKAQLDGDASPKLMPSRTIQSPPAVDAFSFDPALGRARANKSEEVEVEMVSRSSEEEMTYALIIEGRSYP